MRRLALALVTLTLAGCGGAERSGNEGGMALASLAGRWQVRGMNEAGDSVVGYQMVATADTSGWFVELAAGRPPVPMRVWVSGDSVMGQTGTFESVLRPGVQVSTESVVWLRGDSMVGKVMAHYSTTGPDSLVRLSLVGRRVAQ